jgi:MFS family permease
MVSVSLTSSPLAAFVLLLTKRNWEVGLATGVGGLSLLLVAPFAGCAADSFGRETMLRVASVITFLSSAFTLVWLLYLQRRVSEISLFEMVLASQFITGIRRGIQQPALDAIFGDSVPSGRRSKIYSYRSSLRKIGSAAGPLVSAAIFLTAGDNWTEVELTQVLVAGAIFRLIPASMLWLLRDARSLGAESEAVHIRSPPSEAHPPEGGRRKEGSRDSGVADGAVDAASAAAADTAAAAAAADTAAAADATDAENPTVNVSAARRRRLGPQHVAPLLAIADIIGKIGSGLSVRFFPLYMWKELDMRPLPVCLILVASQLGGAAWTMLAQRLSVCIGRIQVVLLLKAGGICCLLAIALLPPPYQTLFAIIPLFLFRTWLMNAPLALSKSVLNDYVPRRHRAKWSSLESINTSSWAGSAVLGGYLSDMLGYRRVFLITAAMQALGLILYTPLVALVAHEGARGTTGSSRVERGQRESRAQATVPQAAAGAEPGGLAGGNGAALLAEPLLAPNTSSMAERQHLVFGVQ